MFKRIWEAGVAAIDVIVGSFASVGEKRQRDAFQEDSTDATSAVATHHPLTQYSITVNRHEIDDPPSKRQRVQRDSAPEASESPQSTTTPASVATSVNPTSPWTAQPPPPGLVFPHGRVDYTTSRHVPRTSVTVGSRRSAFSPPGAMASTKLSRDPEADHLDQKSVVSQSDRQLGDTRQLRINASLAQFDVTPLAMNKTAAHEMASSRPAHLTGQISDTGFAPLSGAPAARSRLQQPAERHWSTKGPATYPGRHAGADFRASTGSQTISGPAAEMSSQAPHHQGPQLSRSSTGSRESAVSQTHAQRKAADKDSLELYKQALQKLNQAQYAERRRERESRMQQIEAQMLEKKHNQYAEAQRGRDAESQKVQMLENASKMAKKEFDERMAEKQRLRSEEDAQRRHPMTGLDQSEDTGHAGWSDDLDRDEEPCSIDDDNGFIDDDYEHDGDYDEDTGYPTITNEQKARAQQVMDGGDLDEIVQSKMMGIPPAKIDITRRDLQCLQPGGWLNDEVINVWMDYVKDRNHRHNEECAGCKPTIYIMKTMFYSRMCVIDGPGGRQDTFDYPGVRRWTKKVDVFAHDMIFIPLHQGAHWALAVVNMRAKKIQYFDSLGGHPDTWLQNVKRWMEEESQHKKQQPFNFSGWNTICSEACPQQHNGFDCGVFMCQFLKHMASHLVPTDCAFDQRDMPMIRWQMVHEIITGRVE